MLDQILNVVKENASELIVNNSAIPNEHNDAAVNDVAQTIVTELKQTAASGNLQSLVEMFSNHGSTEFNLAKNPIVGNVVSSVVSKLSNYGVNAASAKGVADILIPTVLSRFSQKVNNPNDTSVDINGLMDSLMGNRSIGFDFSSALSKINNGKNVDIPSLTDEFLGGSDKTKGGLSGLIGKFFGR